MVNCVLILNSHTNDTSTAYSPSTPPLRAADLLTFFIVFISVLGLPLCLALPVCFFSGEHVENIFDLFNFLWLGTGTTSRLKQLGMEFTVWVFKHVSNL